MIYQLGSSKKRKGVVHCIVPLPAQPSLDALLPGRLDGTGTGLFESRKPRARSPSRLNTSVSDEFQKAGQHITVIDEQVNVDRHNSCHALQPEYAVIQHWFIVNLNAVASGTMSLSNIDQSAHRRLLGAVFEAVMHQPCMSSAAKSLLRWQHG